MRVLICGGRDYGNSLAVKRAMRELVERDGPVTCVIQGGARGADFLGKVWAEREGIPVFECRANWNRFGKRAGHVRNGWMIEHGKPDLIVAFPGGRGTENMIAQAYEAGLPVMMPVDFAASADTRPKGGDAKQAPFTSGAVLSDSEADAQGTRP